MTPPPDRVACCITGCRRTFKREAGDADGVRVICGRHWRMAPKSWRRRGTLFRRAMNSSRNPGRADRAAMAWDRTWERCRRYIEDVIAGRVHDSALEEFLETL